MSRRWTPWARTALPIVLVLCGIVIGYAFNIFIGAAVAVIGIAIGISYAIQTRRPVEPGE